MSRTVQKALPPGHDPRRKRGQDVQEPGQCRDADDSEFYSEEFEYYWREANTIAGRHSFYLYEVIDLLLKHGLDPNYTVDHDFCLMEFVIGIVNGYIAADTLNLLLESGGNPNIISSGENMFDQICFDVDFDAVEQRDRRRYDSLVHCWMVLLAYGGKTMPT